MANKYKIMDEDKKQIIQAELPFLTVISVHNGWHQNAEKVAKKVCDLLNADAATPSMETKERGEQESETIEQIIVRNMKAVENETDGKFLDMAYDHFCKIDWLLASIKDYANQQTTTLQAEIEKLQSVLTTYEGAISGNKRVIEELKAEREKLKATIAEVVEYATISMHSDEKALYKEKVNDALTDVIRISNGLEPINNPSKP